MSDVIVPEGMLKAAGKGSDGLDPCGFYLIGPLTAALVWLAENPIVPTDEQEESLRAACLGVVQPTRFVRNVAVEWQRRMFLVPEPKADPLVMYIMRHFADVVSDERSLRNRAESAIRDYAENFDHGKIGKGKD